MGLEVLDEFRPITPVRTVSAIARNFNHRSTGFTVHEPDDRKELAHLHDDNVSDNDNNNDDGDAYELAKECHSPRSASQTLKSPCVCPPAPKKPRLTKRTIAPPAQAYFQVPYDFFDSLFVLHTKPSQKIKPSSCTQLQLADC